MVLTQANPRLVAFAACFAPSVFTRTILASALGFVLAALLAHLYVFHITPPFEKYLLPAYTLLPPRRSLGDSASNSPLQPASSAITLKHKDINQKLMGFIYSLNAQKVGNVEENGDVFSMSGQHLGKVTPDGHVYSLSGHIAGNIDGSGRVFEAGKHIGVVHSDGVIYDLDGKRLGHAEPPHAEFGGAALLLLIR
jgi:hypothetical protein